MQKSRRLIEYLLLIPAVLMSCQKSLTHDELQQYLVQPENGLLKADRNGDLELEVIYTPYELLFSDSDSTKANNLAYFKVYLSYQDKDLESGLVGHPREVVSGLSYNFKNYVNILVNEDIIKPISSISMRTYGLGKQSVFLTAFDKKELLGRESITFNVNLSEIDLPSTQVEFDVKNIINIPHVKITGDDKK